MPSAAFERFRFSFFEDLNSARDGLDSRSLAELEGEERARAEDMLIHYLPDTRGVIGLGVLRSRRAEPLLVPLFEEERREKGSDPTYLARALWRIRPDPRWRSALIEVLSSAELHIHRSMQPSRCAMSTIPRSCPRSRPLSMIRSRWCAITQLMRS